MFSSFFREFFFIRENSTRNSEKRSTRSKSESVCLYHSYSVWIDSKEDSETIASSVNFCGLRRAL